MFFLEFLFDSILEGWLHLMGWIVPEERLKPVHAFLLQIGVMIFSAILIFVFLFGVFVVAVADVPLKDFWIPIFVPLGIMVLQMIAGICVRISSRRKNRGSQTKDD